jgi:cell division protein FtsI/penicillin-binding protein 2
MYYSGKKVMDISKKTNRVLHLISLCLILILIRTWYLGVVQHDYHVMQSKKPQRRVIIEKAERATIYDRFGIPMAVNKIQYNASVCYANIRQIPSTIWKKAEDGTKVRVAARVEYISELALTLSKELGLDATKIEDIIHGKAAILPHTPFVIKEDISEEQYHRLRMLEKDWVGLQAERVSRRHYPFGKVGCDVIGYLGTIDQAKYLQIAHELSTIEDYLIARERNENPFLPEGFKNPEDVYHRFVELQEKAYTMNDLIGKSGVEAYYEEALRGYYGKHIYEIDTKGNCLQELPGSRPSLPGKKITLTISAELQDYAEKLLSSIEGSRQGGDLDETWMRGGAVVAMIPQTGEVVAMASYPRFDPNDFIPVRDPDVKKEKEQAVKKWLENEGYLSGIWDGKRPIEREYYSFVQGKYLEEKMTLTWERFTQAILPKKGPLLEVMSGIGDIKTALQVQEYGIYHPLLRELVEDDRLLVIDLCHLIAPQELFELEIVPLVGHLALADHRIDQQMAVQLLAQMKEEVKELFADFDFADWRREHFKEYLKTKRQEEKQQKKYARPYTDYLDRIEEQLFHAFWDAYKSVFLYTALTGQVPIAEEKHPQLQAYFNYLVDFHKTKVTPETRLQQKLSTLPTHLGVAYLKTLRSFEDLTAPLQGNYTNLRKHEGEHLEKDLAAAFYPLYGYGFSRSQSFRQTSAQGSVFKLVTAYQTMMERREKHKDLNPFTIIDDLQGNKLTNSPKQILGSTLDGTPYYRQYKGGNLPRSSHSGMGKIDIIGALEQSSNLYFAIAAGEHIQNPTSLANTAHLFALGEKTGIDLPYEAPGNLPNDLDQNRTGLYSFSIGQHTLEVSTLQSATMLAGFANQGKVVKPHVLKQMEGPERVLQYDNLSEEALPLSEKLFSVKTTDREENIVYVVPTEVKRTIPFPQDVFNMITKGMHQVVAGPRGSARPSIMRNFSDNPSAVRDYYDTYQSLIAKTGTAQIRYKQTVSKAAPAVMRDNVWFAAISYPDAEKMTYEDPELVVVVFLRFRQSGREGGTIAAQIVKKWREIQAKQ